MHPALRVLGLIRRAGKLCWGYNTACEAMRNGEARLLLLAADLSEKTKKNARFEAERHGVPLLLTACTMEDFRTAMGKRTGVLAVLDGGFAEKIRREYPGAPIEEREDCCL